MTFYQYPDYMYHYGVKGMKWGVRRAQKKQARMEARQQKKNKKEQRKFQSNVNKNWTKSYNKATDKFNADMRKINDKYKNDKFDDNFSTKSGQQYVKEVNSTWQKHYSQALLEDFGPEPISKGKDWVKNAPMMDSYESFIKR